jgi:RNA polymerase sigma factor (sigma-70 family)
MGPRETLRPMNSLLHTDLAQSRLDDRLRRADDRRRAAASAGPAAARDAHQLQRGAAEPEQLERVLAAAAAGSEPAWTWLERRFSALIRRVARSHRLAPDDVQDVTQTTWLRLFEHIARLRDPQRVGAWLATTARRESLRVISGRAREQIDETAAHTASLSSPSPEELCQAAEVRAVVERSLDRLPERHRELMRSLLAEGEPSYDEITARTGVPRGSIGPIRGRCLQRLRDDPALQALRET